MANGGENSVCRGVRRGIGVGVTFRGEGGDSHVKDNDVSCSDVGRK